MSREAGWVETTLGEVANWGSGGTPSRRNPEFFKGTIPWIKTGELGEKYIQRCEENISEEAIQRSSAKIFKKGSVGIAMYGATIGKLSIFGVDASTNQACAVAEPKEILNKEFLYYFLLSERWSLIKAGKGGAQPNISQGILKEWPIRLPSISEQKDIVAKIETLFSELDKGIESLKTARQQLKAYRQAVLKHAFEGKLTEQWRQQNPDKLESPEQLLAHIRHEREQRYQQQIEEWKQAVKAWEENDKDGKKPVKPKKTSELKEIDGNNLSGFSCLPHGWAYVRLGEVIDEPTYGTSAKCGYESGDTGVLRIPNIADGFVDADDLKFSSFDIGEVDHLALQAGDLLTIRSNGSVSLVGSCAMVSEKDTKYIFAGYLIRLRPNQKVVSPKFLLHAMSSHLLRKQIETVAKSTSGVNNINAGEIKNLIIPLPSIEEQIELLKSVDVIEPSIGATENEIEIQKTKSEILRQSILKKAFTGNLII